MTYETRFEFMRPLVEGKRVLEIGPAELVGTVNRHKLERWIHGLLSEVTSKLIGIECNPEQVAALTELGYDIREGDAENFEVKEEIDVVVAGELIEHLSNPGKFLDCAYRQLEPGGRLVLTTPNRFAIEKITKILRTGVIPPYVKPIAKHVLFFDSDAMSSLLERHGYVDIQIEYCRRVGARGGPLRRALLAITNALRPVMLPVLLATARKPRDGA